MKMIRVLILGAATLMWASLSMAEDKGGLFVEPGVTYEVGSADGNFPGTNGTDTDADGLGVMARVGFHLNEAFFVGLDGRYSRLTVKDTNAPLNYDATGSAWNWGPVVGFQMPHIGLRVWGDYIVDDTIDPEANNGFDVKYGSGNGYRIGAGFHIGVVSLNLEYQDVKLDKVTVQQIGPFAPGTDFGGVELKNKSWIASVSFPMEF